MNMKAKKKFAHTFGKTGVAFLQNYVGNLMKRLHIYLRQRKQ